MCRITGIFSPGQYINKDLVIKMRDTMIHGGPDAGGLWIEGPIGFGHRRLSIIDLEERANQPFHWRHYVIVYNGEVYNYQEIRLELQALGYTFTTQSDTEVLMASFHEWGIDAPTKFHGMFAFALWDKRTQKLWLCRDRVGVKPLYIYEKQGILLFASELKGILAFPGIDRNINHAAIAKFMHYGYIAAPASIYTCVRKLMPGTIEEINLDGVRITHQYWNAAEAYTKNQNSSVEELEGILNKAFQYRMVSDVPVGVFLSGGIDSSLLCATLARQHGKAINTFTIGFHEKEFNEAPYAKSIAKHLRTNHKELYCSASDFKALVPHYFQMYDEPFGDSSGIPTYLVSKLAQEHVKVALSADGADELFGGYAKYRYSASFFHHFKHYPPALRHLAANLIKFSLPLISHRSLQPLLKIENWHNKLVKGHQALSANELDTFFRQASGYLSPEATHSYGLELVEMVHQSLDIKTDKLLSYLGLLDIKHYLEGDILCKVDRASMYTALESREPFLDQDLIEYALQLPDSYKIRNGSGKYLLRLLLREHLPAELFERPKHGFRVPIGRWLKTVFKDSLLELSQNLDFFNRFGLNQAFAHKRIKAFLEHKTFIVSEYEIWFLFVLYQWDSTWNRS